MIQKLAIGFVEFTPLNLLNPAASVPKAPASPPWGLHHENSVYRRFSRMNRVNEIELRYKLKAGSFSDSGLPAISSENSLPC
jgi:hypothetical protein